jgi:hypothetical protein
MVFAGGARDGVGVGGAGVEEPKRFLIAVNGEVKLLNRLLEGVEGFSLPVGVGDLEAGDVSSSRGGDVGSGTLAASWTCRSNAIADSSPVANDGFTVSDSSTSNESNSEIEVSAVTEGVFKVSC